MTEPSVPKTCDAGPAVGAELGTTTMSFSQGSSDPKLTHGEAL
jgi:hypothetical protein